MKLYVVVDGEKVEGSVEICGHVVVGYDFCSKHCQKMFISKSPIKWAVRQDEFVDRSEFGTPCCECDAMIEEKPHLGKYGYVKAAEFPQRWMEEEQV